MANRLTGKAKVKKLISESRLREALDQLDYMLTSENTYLRSDLLLLRSRFEAVIRSEIRGRTPTENESDISDGLLTLLDLIDDKDLVKSILVVSSTDDTIADMKKLFSKFYPDADFVKVGNEVEEAYDVVVIDGYFGDPQLSEFEQLNQVAQNFIDKKQVIVYFVRGQSAFVNQNRAMVNAANSPFTLFPRIREVIDYQRYMAE